MRLPLALYLSYRAGGYQAWRQVYALLNPACVQNWERQGLAFYHLFGLLGLHLERKLTVFDGDAYMTAVFKFAKEQFFGQRPLDFVLDQTRHRTRAHQGIVPMLR